MDESARATAGARPGEDARAPEAEMPPRRWLGMYLLLAALNVAGVVGALWLSNRSARIYQDAVGSSEEWLSRASLYSELGRLAGEVNHPGAEVFDTRDVEGEREKLGWALSSFRVAHEGAVLDVGRMEDANESVLLGAVLRPIRSQVESLARVAEETIGAVDREDLEAAGYAVARLNAKHAEIDASLATLRSMAERIEASRLERRRREAGANNAYASAVSVLIGVTVVTLAWYGLAISRKTERDAREAEERLRVLRTLHGELKAKSVELSKAREQAESANRAKSEFLANMSHEIRTPITAMLGYAELLQDPGATAEDRTSHAATIQRNGEHLATLINDLLDLSKVESGRMSVEEIVTRPMDVVNEVVSLMLWRARSKGVRLLVETRGAVPRMIRSDPVRLRQVLVNLVGNAVKFTERGHVIVRVRHEEGADPRVVFEVEDTGIGMTVEQASRVFEPFVQADASTTRRYGGTGLGLAISKRLAVMLGGDLSFTTQVGVGSTFVATVSARGAVFEEAAEARPAAAERGGAAPAIDVEVLAGVTVLVAEDGVDNRRLFEAFLRGAGAEVTLVEHGRAAVDAATSGRFDVVLMDMQMPEMDGYDATRELRRRGVGVPIVAVTAHSGAEERARCLEAGCDDHLPKPVRRAQLVDMVRAWVARKGKAAA